MRLITHAEFIKAATNASVRLINGQIHVNSLNAVQFTWKDAIDFVVFAKLVLDTITSKEQILFFHEYGIWPSSENQYLFNLVMKVLVNEEIATPAGKYFYFASEDRDQARTLLQLGLQSGWGGLLLGGDNNWFYFNHDGHGMVESSVDVTRELGQLAGLKIIPATFMSESSTEPNDADHPTRD
jgi:hypothetical protein